MHHEPFIRRCYTLAQQAVAKGNHPFGALLVRDGQLLFEAENTIFTDSDPTAHAETNLVRLAAKQLDRVALAQCTLYTSTEPCIMCSGAIYWANIGGVVYGCPETGLAQYTSGEFLTPCREIFAKGLPKVTVIGPILPAEGAQIHAAYWPHLAGA